MSPMPSLSTDHREEVWTQLISTLDVSDSGVHEDLMTALVLKVGEEVDIDASKPEW
jgi:hypothetical protein